MSFHWFVARRYFLSKRRKNFINIIALLSMGGVAFATAALVIVLSVFNGIGGLLRSLYTAFDPPIRISASVGKSFAVNDSLRAQIRRVDGVADITETIEDYVYVRNKVNQTQADMVVTLRAVGDSFTKQRRMDDHIVAGTFRLWQDSIPCAIIGAGVRNSLSVSLEEPVFPLQVYYVRNTPARMSDPSSMYTSRALLPTAIFAIEKNFDENYIFAPLSFAEDLFGYRDRRTSLEVILKPGAEVTDVQRILKDRLGSGFEVLSNDEQHRDLYRLLRLEKVFTFLSLALLIVVASINIFFSLMMLVIDKRKDVLVLRALGAGPVQIRRIFVAEAFLVSGYGTIIGLVLGFVVCLLQQEVGLVGMGMENAVVAHYPVDMQITDFLLIAGFNLLVTLIISVAPARLAARYRTHIA